MRIGWDGRRADRTPVDGVRPRHLLVRKQPVDGRHRPGLGHSHAGSERRRRWAGSAPASRRKPLCGAPRRGRRAFCALAGWGASAHSALPSCRARSSVGPRTRTPDDIARATLEGLAANASASCGGGLARRPHPDSRTATDGALRGARRTVSDHHQRDPTAVSPREGASPGQPTWRRDPGRWCSWPPGAWPGGGMKPIERTFRPVRPTHEFHNLLRRHCLAIASSLNNRRTLA